MVASEIDAFENDEPEEEPVAEEPVAEPPWRRRIPITIEGTETNEILFNFPVMVHLSSGTLETDLLNETGDNLAFFPEEWTEGLEPLDHSISTWNPQGDSIAWVKIPFILAGSDRTTIWLYYGGTQRVEPADEGVWENAYTLVMHFEEGNASEGYRDSGVFANHSVPSPGHTEPDTATGAVGNAIDIVETTDAVIVPNSPSLETMEPFSISMLVNFRGYRTARVFSKGDYYLQTKASSGQAQYKFELQFDNATLSTADDQITIEKRKAQALDTWQFVTVVWDGNAGNGSVEIRTDLTPLPLTVGENWAAGTRDDDSTKPFGIGNGEFSGGTVAIDGLIDEVRVARTERSLAWLTAEHRSLTGTLLSLGTVETIE